MGEIYFTGDYLLKGVKIGIVAGMVALTVSFLLIHFDIINTFLFSKIILTYNSDIQIPDIYIRKLLQSDEHLLP